MSEPVLTWVGPLPTPPVITMGSRNSVAGCTTRPNQTVPASGTNPFNAANEMVAYPFCITDTVTVYKGFWVNGSSIGGNSSLAIYNSENVQLVQSASTLNAGASSPQSVAMQVSLSPGVYFAAMASNTGTTTNRYFRWSIATTGAVFWRAYGCWRQAGITLGSLPATATPVGYTNIAMPIFGLITRSNFDV
jgi:hypothetical protein